LANARGQSINFGSKPERFWDSSNSSYATTSRTTAATSASVSKQTDQAAGVNAQSIALLWSRWESNAKSKSYCSRAGTESSEVETSSTTKVD
jgi:hypothetical protein